MGRTDNKNDWECPVCNHNHSKRHYAYKDQIDEKKKPLDKGRVKFDREESCHQLKGDTPEKYGINDSTGPMFDEYGYPQPLFCPHCGWTQGMVIIIKTK